MRRKPTKEEYEIIVQELREFGSKELLKKLNPDNVLFNGVTCSEVSDSPNGKMITYIEDDLVDENGYPYIFESKYFDYMGILTKGRRMISLNVEGYYYLIPANGTSYELVGAVHPDVNFDVDKGKSVKLPTPLILDLPRETVREVTKEDKEMIKRAYKKYGRYTGSKIVGGIALGLLFFIFIALGYIFTVAGLADGSSPVPFIIITVIAVILLIASIVFTVIFTNNSHIWIATKKKYIRKVMLTGAYGYPAPGMPVPVGFYVWEGNKAVHHTYAVSFAQIVLDKKAGYGTVVYMLTNKKDINGNDAFGNGVFISE